MPIRTFVAVPVAEAWESYLAGVVRDLAGLASGVSWVKPGNFHMTIRFLGDLGESGAARVGEAVARAAEGVEAPLAALGAVGAFPSLQRPRVLWVAVVDGDGSGVGAGTENAALVALGRRVNAAIDAAGFERADKPFRPHLTLGRVREGARGLEAVRGYAPPAPPAAARLDRIVVMKSDLHPSGARYTALREVRLPPPH